MFWIFFYKFENILPGMRRKVNISTLMVFRNQRRYHVRSCWQSYVYILWKEKLKDTKGIIRNRKSKKDRQHNDQKNRTKVQTVIYKTQPRKLKLEQHHLH